VFVRKIAKAQNWCDSNTDSINQTDVWFHSLDERRCAVIILFIISRLINEHSSFENFTPDRHKYFSGVYIFYFQEEFIYEF